MIKQEGERVIATFGQDDMTIACTVQPEGGIVLLCDAPVKNEQEMQNIIEKHERIRFVFPNIQCLMQLCVQLTGLIGIMAEATHPINIRDLPPEVAYGRRSESTGLKLMGDK